MTYNNSRSGISNILTPELLAPASNLTNAIIAYKNGADAVYAGLKEFNARERSENFTVEELSTLMQYAKSEKKKVFLTLNTLFKDSETKKMLNFLENISTIMPDSIIVQDFGVLRLAKKYFPELTVHASTQMGIHNSAGINLIQSLGAERVILERQVTINELKLIKKNTNIELEVFVHGALCSSLSGSCLFSSWMGGHSGNRGKCKQPCRRRFHSEKGNGFFFSANDLYSLDVVGDLKDLGINSFKIEGRVKKSDYVENVVKAYRMVIDAEKSDRKSILGEARNILSRSGGRKWSGGFRDNNALENVISHEKLGVSGSLCGFLENKNDKGLKIKAIGYINIGDYLRVQPKSGDEGPTVFVSYIKINGKNVKTLKKGEVGFIGYKKELPDGDCNIYKVGAFRDDKYKIPEVNKKDAIVLHILVSQKGFKISIINDENKTSTLIDREIEIAQKRGVDTSKIENEFIKIYTDNLYVANVNVEIKNNEKLFILDKMIKEIKKEFVKFLSNYEFEEKEIDYSLDTKDYIFDKEITIAKDAKVKGGGIKAGSIFNYGDYHQEVILPQFCPETYLNELVKKIDLAYKKGIRKFRVTSIYGFELLKQYEDLIISSSFPLPVSNSEAFAQVQEIGADKIMLWPELEKESYDSLVKNFKGKAEIYKFGKLPIYQTRAILPAKGDISDGRGAEFSIENDKFLTLLYPEKALETPNYNNASHFYDYTHTEIEAKSSDFNYNREFI